MTAELSSTKQLKVEENNGHGGGTDRMRRLPDSVLLNILSFLPTKTSVATMTLVSRRWRNLWELLEVFDFSIKSYDDADFKRFAVFVNAALTLRRSRDIRKIHLFCCISDKNTFPADSIHTWIRAAMGPCLEELRLTIFNMDGSSLVKIPPTHLLNCTSLDVVDSLDALLSGCPVLQTLKIIDAPVSLSKVRLPPSLKRFKFTSSEIYTYLEMDAPRLQKLSITTSGTFDACHGNLQNVVKAKIDVFSLRVSDSFSPLRNLLRALSRTKHLVLCPSTIQRLLSSPIINFPEFRYLLKLNLNLPCFNSNLVVYVLEKCHILQDLIIKSGKEALLSRTWEPQSTRIPNCLVSHLTSIHIEGYHGFEDELSFAEYILQSGLVLKTMLIISDISLNQRKKLSILKRLSNIPKGSVMCQLVLD